MQPGQANDSKRTEAGGADPNTPSVVLVGVVGAIMVFVVIVALQALFYNTETQTIGRINEGDPQLLGRLRAEQLEAVSSYAWKDRDKGVAVIPIDRAMELTVRDIAANRPPPHPTTGASQ